ncbi:MAG: glucan biosynthesis protein [Candidatus Saelkia tenebricola]|nr:glucan biosynthesis protein [Candidatus Saelkia tenebricola]
MSKLFRMKIGLVCKAMLTFLLVSVVSIPANAIALGTGALINQDSSITAVSTPISVDTGVLSDLIIIKGYNKEDIDVEFQIREAITPYLGDYYGIEMDRSIAMHEVLIASWARRVEGGLVNGSISVVELQEALSLAAGGELDISDESLIMPFVDNYVDRGAAEDYSSFWQGVQNEHDFTLDQVLSNRLAVEFSFGAWQRDPLLHTSEGMTYSFDPNETFGGSMYSLRLDYDVSSPEHNVYNGFYMQLPNQDLSHMEQFVFFAKGGSREDGADLVAGMSFGRQDQNAGYTSRFEVEFKDNEGNKASYMVTGVKQDEWTPVVIDKNSMAGSRDIDWTNIAEVNIIFSDAQTRPDKDGVIYIDGLVNNPREVLVDAVTSELDHLLSRFYRMDEAGKQMVLRRYGIEGIEYVDMDEDYIEEICTALIAHPDVIVNSGGLLMQEMALPDIPDIASIDLIEELLLPQILTGAITPECIEDGYALELLELARMIDKRDVNFFVIENAGIDSLKGIDEITQILVDTIAQSQDPYTIANYASLNGLALYEADFFEDEIRTSLGISSQPLQLNDSVPTILQKAPFIAQIGMSNSREYVVVTGVSKKGLLGNLSPVYVDYVDSSGEEITEKWDSFKIKWLQGNGTALLSYPVLVELDNHCDVALIKEVTDEEVVCSASFGAVTFSREEFEDYFTGRILTAVRPYGEIIETEMVEEQLLQKALQLAVDNVSPQPTTWFEYPSGMPYTAYERIGGDQVYSDSESWIVTMPHGVTNTDPLRVFTYNELLDDFTEILYSRSQYDYVNPDVQSYLDALNEELSAHAEETGAEFVPLTADDIPQEALGITDVRVGHKMAVGQYPSVIDISGNGYVRFTAFPPLTMGASLRLGLHNVGGVEMGGNAEENHPKIVESYIRKMDDNSYNILLLVNADDYSGVLDINLTPGAETEMHVKAQYFPKRDISIADEPHTGFVGFSSMFFKGPEDTPDNSYDQAHDSDVIVVNYSDGSSSTQALLNPDQATMFDFFDATKEVTGFSLQQTERDPNAYSPRGDFFHTRCSYDVEVVQSNIPLTTRLFIFPTTGITVDNVAAFLASLADLSKAETIDDAIEIEYILRARQ